MSRVDFLSRGVPAGLTSLSGGLNSTDNPLFLKENEASDLQNIDFDTNGAFKKRSGYSRLNTSAFNSGATWTSLHFFESSTADFLIGTCGNKLAKMDDFDGTWDDITGSLTITAGNNNIFSWRTFNGKVYGTNNVDVPILWSGSGNGATWTVVTGITKVKWIEVFENYMFLANVELSSVRQATRLYWSTIKDAETWSTTDFVEIGLQDGQEITGIKTLGDRLVIFKERSIYIGIFTGDSNVPFIFVKTKSHVGSISGYSVQEVNNGLIFLSQDGFYFFNGTTSEKISERISVTMDTFNKNRFSVSQSAYQKERNRYWLALTTSGGSTNNRVITFDSFNNAFSLYKGHNANCFVTLHTSGQERIYFGDYAGFVYRADTGLNDNPSGTATSIEGYLKTKWFDFGDQTNQKATPNLVVYFTYKTGIVTFAYAYDLSEGEVILSFSTTAPGELWDTAVWDVSEWGASGGFFRRIDLDGRGRVVRYRFYNNTLSETFHINGIATNVHLETDG